MRTVLSCLLAALLLAACGGGDGDTATSCEDLVTQVVADIAANPDVDPDQFIGDIEAQAEEAGCDIDDIEDALEQALDG